VSDRWSTYAEAYRESEAHRSGADLDLIVAWAEGKTALDVATGGGHVARRLREAGLDVVTVDPAPGMQADVVSRADHLPFADWSFDVVVTTSAPSARSRLATWPPPVATSRIFTPSCGLHHSTTVSRSSPAAWVGDVR